MKPKKLLKDLNDVFHLIDGFPKVLLGEKSFFDDASSPNTLFPNCFNVGKVSFMLLAVHVFGNV